MRYLTTNLFNLVCKTINVIERRVYKALPVGTKRERKDGVYQKQPGGTWVKVTEEKKESSKKIIETEKEFNEFHNKMKDKYGEELWSEMTDSEMDKYENLERKAAMAKREKEQVKPKRETIKPKKVKKPEVKIEGSKYGEALSQDEANDYYKKNEIPEGWMVHGRRERGAGGVENLETGFVVLGSDDWQTADDYAGEEGTVWMFKPKDEATVVDLRDSGQLNSFVEKIKNDYNAGVIDNFPQLKEDIDSAMRMGDGWDLIKEDIDPDDIVNSAGWFDEPNFIDYLYESGLDFVYTGNGSAVINNDSIDKIMIDR